MDFCFNLVIRVLVLGMDEDFLTYNFACQEYNYT